MVTVALDSNREAARPFVEVARPAHPSLVDPNLSLVDRFGITNVPFGIWIDEQGTIVRPAEVAFAVKEGTGQEQRNRQQSSAQIPEARRKIVEEMMRSVGEPGRYGAAVRDWVAKGEKSRYVLAPVEVMERSRARPIERGQAAAHFELAMHLCRTGASDAAADHFRQAHRLDPTNWSYVRDVSSLGDPALRGVFGRDMLEEVAVVGADTFYPPLIL
jgi:hypothetical protein